MPSSVETAMRNKTGTSKPLLYPLFPNFKQEFKEAKVDFNDSGKRVSLEVQKINYFIMFANW